MRRLATVISMALLAFGLSCCTKPQENEKPDTPPVTQSDDPVTPSADPSGTPSADPSQEPEPILNFSVVTDPVTLPAEGGSASIAYTLETNQEDVRVDATTSAAFILDLTVGEGVITFRADANRTCVEAMGEISVTCSGIEEVYHVSVIQPGLGDIEPALPQADLLDVEFLADGTARNVAPGAEMKVQTFAGSALSTYYSETYRRYVAHFNRTPATQMSDGFYKADYSSLSGVQQKLKSAVTMEALVRLDSPAPGNAETKFFSSMQSGGIGFLIPTAGNGASWTWLPNVSTTGSSNWIWTKSGVTPVVGQYVHLVGIWDKESGISRIYVDGVCKATQHTDGSQNLPGVNSCWWFCIGGDPNSATTAESAWCGDIVLARIFSRSLSEEEIQLLWHAVDVPAPEDIITLSDVRFMSPLYIRPEHKFRVYAQGLKPGDVIRLSNQTNTYTLDTEVFDGYAKALVGGDVASGTYSMTCIRGKATYPIGTVQLTVSDDAVVASGTRVVAHRGYHDGANGSQRPENSIAALKAAQELGIYGSEFDVWITSDGAVFCNHDGKYAGVTIKTSTSDVVSKLKLSNGEYIPTLEQYLDQGLKDDQLQLVLEIKDHGNTAQNNAVTDYCLAAVKERHLEKRVDWISFNYDVCKRVHAALPEAMVEYLSGGKSPASLYADGIMGLDYSSMTLQWVREAHERGMIVNVWTIDSPNDMLKYISWGVDFLTTNRPDIARELCSLTWVE